MDSSPSPGAPRSRRFDGRRADSVAAARGFVRSVLEAAGTPPEPLDTACLLVSELATNSFLHARTEVEVTVRAGEERIRLEVADRRPDLMPVPRTCPPNAGTGRGLGVVTELADRFGADRGGEEKRVWCELLLREGRPGAPSRWPPARPLAGPDTLPVVLIDLPGALHVTSEHHRHAVLRELALAGTIGDRLGVDPEELRAARDTCNVLGAAAQAALGDRRSVTGIRTVTLSLPAGSGPAVRLLRRVLESAEEASRDELLLTRPGLPQSQALQDWFFGQITAQLDGALPTAWTVVPRDPSASPLDLVPWDEEEVHTSRLATVVVDDDNLIVAVNAPAADLLGWDRDALVGRYLTTLIPDHLRQRHLAAFHSLLLTGQPRILGRPVPLPALHRDGHLVPVRLLIQAQEMADGHTVFIGQMVPRSTAFGPDPRPSHRRPAVRSTGVPEPPVPSHRGAPEETPDLPEAGRRPAAAAAAMAAMDRLSLLADVGRELADASELGQGLHAVSAHLVRRLADWCVIDLLDGETVERVGVMHRDRTRAEEGGLEGRLPPLSESARGPLARTLRGAGPLLLDGRIPPHPGECGLDSGYRSLFEQFACAGAVVAPLRARRQIFGALTLAREDPSDPFVESDLAFVDDLARAVALAVENQRLYDGTRYVAERLQRDLLPALPRMPGLRLDASYATSSVTTRIGGDWYDCFRLPDGDLALIIGDIAGHDLEAAITMSQLRSMLRGIALDRQEPAEEVLRRLDLADRSLRSATTATCVYGRMRELRPGDWEFHFSSAGHLPPLLVDPERGARLLEGGTGPMLGTGHDLPREGASVRVPQGATLLLFTDGLAERRGEDIDDSLRRLHDQALALAHEPLGTLCDELLIRLGADATDDIALLAVRPGQTDDADGERD
ncbi:SpoIIE family protein phosphatase [Streptomyces sp. NPDC002734]|uniref:SpoIIE family protein phosphatase n=1 Tax=Streptomyces sp. NPDC002734 TaxID=3154426 RepID=UPI003316C037